MLAALLALGASPATTSEFGPASAGQGKPPGSFKLIGHNSLDNRGMNAAIAIHEEGNKSYAYIGSRTDGPEPRRGVLVVDITDPASPTIVHEIGPPNEGNTGETSRELRVWPEKDLLIVMNLGSNCSYIIHGCSPSSVTVADNFRFYDISGDKAAAPELVAEYEPSLDPHEFFLWDDPKRPGRALMFISTPGGSKQLLITDVSKAREGKFTELATWTTFIPSQDTDNRLHSLSISNDGKRGYVAYLGGGFFIIDTSDFARGVAKPEVRLVTPIPNRAHWGDPGVHSAVKLYGRSWVLTTDEVYGELGGVLAGHGCPWGWVRMVNIRNPKKPKVKAEFKLKANQDKFCESAEKNTPARNNYSSWSAHNPTLTKNIAFVTWHSAGLQAIRIKRPAKPRQLAKYLPEPEPAVLMEDPALSSGQDKVVMWSYPIIKDGLIYVVDIRNGLYVLEYKGPFERQVKRIGFLEGNSNLGDALRLGN